MKNSKIGWTEHTWNPWWGCVEVSPACNFCYARTLAHRFGRARWGKDTPRWFPSEAQWREPLRWHVAAGAAKQRHNVFCASMGDIFENRRDLNEARGRTFALAETCSNLDWLFLTKRPQEIMRLIPAEWARCGCPQNIWLLTTVESEEYLWRADALLKVPALSGVYGISNEPALGSIRQGLARRLLHNDEGRRINWVITGGESGAHARDFDIDEARQLRDLCAKAEVPFFFKQAGKRPVSLEPFPVLRDKAGADHDEWPEDLRVQEYPK